MYLIGTTPRLEYMPPMFPVKTSISLHVVVFVNSTIITFHPECAHDDDPW